MEQNARHIRKTNREDLWKALFCAGLLFLLAAIPALGQETDGKESKDAAPFSHYASEPKPDQNKALALWGTGGASALAGLFLFGWRRKEGEKISYPETAHKKTGYAPLSGTAPRLLGIFLIAAAAGIFIGVLYYQHLDRGVPLIFSGQAMLRSLWSEHKKHYVEAGSGRTVDRQKENITTSEGQSYTMLRAVWMDDKETFDRSWQWTKDNLAREDGLFSWLYGKKPDGTMGVLTAEGGRNTASDADSDIALSLLFAYARWGEDEYLKEAETIIPAIWEKEVVMIHGAPYLAANNLEKNAKTDHVLVNPSYFTPYAYRLFAEVDATHPWMELVDSSYIILEKSAELPLDKTESAGLPPDWLYLDRKTGALRPAENLSSNYGFDAMRVPWRLSLDYVWFGEPRAKAMLLRFAFLGEEWRTNGTLGTAYAHDGSPVIEHESPAFYGGAIGYFKVAESGEFKKVSKRKLEALYSPDFEGWKRPMSYYDDNWAWFGLALSRDALPNLFSPVARASR